MGAALYITKSPLLPQKKDTRYLDYKKNLESSDFILWKCVICHRVICIIPNISWASIREDSASMLHWCKVWQNYLVNEMEVQITFAKSKLRLLNPLQVSFIALSLSWDQNNLYGGSSITLDPAKNFTPGTEAQLIIIVNMKTKQAFVVVVSLYNVGVFCNMQYHSKNWLTKPWQIHLKRIQRKLTSELYPLTIKDF